MTWASALKLTARSGLAIERAKLTPLLAVRGAAGVAFVVFLNLWLASPTLAVSSAFGAFSSGITTFQRSWRPRPLLALAVAGALSVSTFLGYLAAVHYATFVLMLAVWTFVAGMAWAIGPVAGVIGTQTISVMLVTVTLPTTVLGALNHALLIAFGGVVQALLIVLVPIRPWGARRDALADALAAEADYARRLRVDPVAPFDPQPLMDARLASEMTPRQARRRPVQLHGPRSMAEQVRPVLASLADPVVGAPVEGPQRDRVNALLGASATVLDAVAHAVRRNKPVRLPPEATAILQVPEDGGTLSGAARRAALRLIALMADAVELTDEPVESTRDLAPGERTHLLRPGVPKLVPMALYSMRRELRWDSRILRHALRVAVVVASSYLVGRTLPFSHGYWAPLTAAMVLRPDFGQTYTRGVARFCGTLVGVSLAGTILVLLSHPGPYISAALTVGCVFLNYLLMRTGVAVTSACVAAYVVFLLAIAGAGWQQTILERVLLTLAGGLLAMLSYALFPAWETPRLRERLAQWLLATGAYAVAVFDIYARPADRRPRQVRDALLDARAARARWEESDRRAQQEPVRHRGLSLSTAGAAEAALSTMGHITMIAEAHLPPLDAPTSPEAVAFVYTLRESLEPAAEAIRGGGRVDFDELRATWRRWEEEAEPDAPEVALRSADLLIDALDDLAEAVSE